MKKIFAILFGMILLSGFLVPGLVLAEETTTSDPADNPLCWTQTQCEIDLDHDEKLDGRFDSESTEAQKVCPGYGYCYPGSVDYTLGVSLPISGAVTTTVSDLGDYINKIYIFLLGVSMIIVVVTLMVGGFQYVASPGGGEAVNKAKEKIKSSLIGLVLLSCAALLLATVNPNLINLRSFSPPKIKTVLFIGDNMKCETLLGAGFRLDDDKSSSAENCGLKGSVIADRNGVELGEPYECIWTKCGSYTFSSEKAAFTFNKVCAPGVRNPNLPAAEAGCVSCEELATDPPSELGVQPSGTMCGLLQPVFSETKNSSWHASCEFSHDVGFEISEIADIVSMGQCATVAYNCDNIDECGDYDNIEAKNNDGYQNLDAFTRAHPFDYSLHKEICEGNPCKAGNKPGLANGCKQEYSEVFQYTIVAFRASIGVISLGSSEAVYAALRSLTGAEANGLSCDPK